MVLMTPVVRRIDDVDALSAWDALLKGAWVVTDHLTDAYLHTMLGRRSPDGAMRPLLSTSEMALAVRRAEGDLVKVIAGASGRSHANVSAHVNCVMRKLKLRSPAHLVAFFEGASVDGPLPAPPGLRASILDAGGDECLVLVYPRPVWQLPASLSNAERRIVLDLIDGASHEDVAAARGTSKRTVANQVAAIFRKLEVRSQIELFKALRAREPRP